MNKRILLVEPAYKTRYPPFGLMKISTYHKMKGDEVVFVKGRKKEVQFEYWDRVYISTLFTWTWDETVKTIKFYHDTLFNFSGNCYVGGVLATLLPDEIFNETGIRPIEGLLDDPSKLDQNDDIIIDHLPPDYSILEEVETESFKYSNTNAYLGYATRGCIRNCDYCAVRTLEPDYVPYVDIKKLIKDIDKVSGAKQNLILMDNNVLASKYFNQIIDDIKTAGFIKGASYENKKRTVDFNQGLDARLLTEKKMKRLAEIPLEPMRLAFDSIEYKEIYVKAVRLAHKHGQKDMSNYILYNFDNDTPEDFYERLSINTELNDEFRRNDGVNTTIYSFPMRFIPLDAKSRKQLDTGNKNWNPRYLRGVQVILTVMRGPVMPGREFFLQAFGRNAEEFKAIVSMPDEFIRNRLVSNWREVENYDERLMPYVRDWMNAYYQLTKSERKKLAEILSINGMSNKLDFSNEMSPSVNKLLGLFTGAKQIVGNYKSNR